MALRTPGWSGVAPAPALCTIDRAHPRTVRCDDARAADYRARKLLIAHRAVTDLVGCHIFDKTDAGSYSFSDNVGQCIKKNAPARGL